MEKGRQGRQGRWMEGKEERKEGWKARNRGKEKRRWENKKKGGRKRGKVKLAHELGSGRKEEEEGRKEGIGKLYSRRKEIRKK